MPIELGHGDLLRADVEALVNTVNSVGFMGRGIAAQFRRRFPENFDAYARACKRGEVRPGAMFVHETGTLTNPRFIINFPTKRHWRAKSRIEDIEAGLVALVDEIRRREIASIAIPPLGCGLGGLDWTDVRPRIERELSALEGVRVVLFAPDGAPSPEDMSKSDVVPSMTPGRAVLVGLMDRYLAGLLDPFVTLLELHKLMYFVQEAGEELRLRYRAAAYGPYAENLRHVLAAIEGHYISGFADGGDAPGKTLSLVPGAIEDARALLAEKKETARRFERVSDLVEGFETPFGLELLATVHWVMRYGRATRGTVIEAVHAWSERKKAMNARQILLAADRLTERGWLPSEVADG